MDLADINDFADSKYTKVDSQINFNLGHAAMISDFPTKFFSVKWEGKIHAPSSEIFRFYLETFEVSDVYFKIEDTVMIDTWGSSNKASVQYYNDYTLEQGYLYDVELWFRQRYG